jgi:hypothetical protein
MKAPLTKSLTAIIFMLMTVVLAYATPPCITQLTPVNGANVTKSATNQYTFSWSAGAAGTLGYEFRLSTNPDGSSPLYKSGILAVTTLSETFTITLNCNTTYYWAAVPFDNTPGFPSFATGCAFNAINIVPAPEPVTYPTDKWSVSVYSDAAFTNYAGYYTQNNTATASAMGLYFISTNAWSSSANPSGTVANTGNNPNTGVPGAGTYATEAFKGCTFSGNTNYSYIYKRTSTLPAGIYTLNLRQTAATGNSFTLSVNSTQYLVDATNASSNVTVYLPENAQIRIAATHSIGGGSSLELRTLALTSPLVTLSPGTLKPDVEICYNTDPSTNLSAGNGARGSCPSTVLTYQWQSSTTSATGPWADLAGVTTAAYNPPSLLQTTYYKRKVYDECGRIAETAVLTITVGPDNYDGGIIAYNEANDTLCTGAIPSAFSSASPASGGITGVTYTYQWQTSNNGTGGWTAIAGETNAAYTPSAPITSTKYYRRLATVFGCNATANPTVASNVIKVFINTGGPAAPVSITGASNICVNQTGIGYQSANSATATTYTWTVPAGVIISSGQGTRFLTVDTDGSFVGGDISVIASNACGSSAAVILELTLSTSCSSTWNGNISSNWGTATNWTPSGVPTAAVDVVIPSGRPNNPIFLSGNANVGALTIDPGASLTIAGGTNFNINKDLTVNGTLTHTAGKIRFVGGAPKEFSSVAPVQTFKNIEINGSDVSISSEVSLTGIVQLTAGDLITNDNVTLLPDNGAVIAFANGNTGTVIGNVTIVKALSNGFKYISSPLVGVTASQLADNMTVVGTTTSRVSAWDYSIPGFKSRLDIAAVDMGSGNAVKLFVPAGGISADFTGTVNNTGSFSSASIPNTTANTNIFMGNPYPSYLDIDATTGWTLTGVSNTFYFWNSSSNSYSTYQKGAPGIGVNGGTNIIPMFQAFFLKTTGSGGSASVTMSPRVRSTSSQGLYRTALSDENLKIAVKSTTGPDADETIIRLSDNSTIAFDDTLDAFKFANPSTSINLASKLDGVEYVINTLPVTSAETIVPLKLTVPAAGTYTISVPSSSNYSVILMDKKLDLQKVADGTDYVFNVASGDDANRFDVVFRTAVTTATKNSASTGNISIATTGTNIVILAKNSLGNATVKVYNATGVLVTELANRDIAAGSTILEDLSLESGSYIIKVSDGRSEYIGHSNIVK